MREGNKEEGGKEGREGEREMARGKGEGLTYSVTLGGQNTEVEKSRNEHHMLL